VPAWPRAANFIPDLPHAYAGQRLPAYSGSPCRLIYCRPAPEGLALYSFGDLARALRPAFHTLLAVTLTAVIAVSVQPSPAAAVPVGGMAAQDLNVMFNAYGDAGGHWTGGDNTASVVLPDGRVAWLFSDTFLGTVNADGSRPANTPMVNNTLVVQSDQGLVSTRHGGTAAAPTALVQPTQAGQYFWAADGLVEGGTLKALYNRLERGSGHDNLDFALKGTSLVTFALPALTVSSVVDLPLGETIGWGSAILQDGSYTYVYGTSSGDSGMRFGHVARVAAGNLGGAWQFWTGTAWSASESDAGRLLSGVGSAYGMIRVGSQYVLVTQDNNQVFNPHFVAYTANSPTGPFSGPISLFTAPEVTPGGAKIAYDARIHPELARTGKLLISYNVNSLDNADNFADARIYRPRFVEVDWPRPVPNPGTLPATPSGVQVSVDDSGHATVTWQAVSGATGYWVYRRDVTAGQTHFSRDNAQVSGTSATLGSLYSGHTYEFRVTAANSAGEGAGSAVVSAVPTVAPPPAPTNVRAVADNAGAITVSWNAVVDAWGYDVRQRDVTAGETEFNIAIRAGGDATETKLENLDHNHVYEFVVSARHGGGESPRSAVATATARYALPGAPTALTATPGNDGTIALSWTAPGPNVWYLVYQRDVTAGETTFTQLPLPITEGTTMTAAYLMHDHVYEFKVAATNRGGEGPASGIAQATARYGLPPAPANLRVTAGAGQATLTWDSAGPNLWYQIYQRNVTTGEATFTELPLPITECCTMTAEFLTNNETYEFKVAATNQAGAGPASAVVSVTPRAPTPPKVTGLTATSQTDGSIRLNWTGPTGDYTYDIYERDVTAGSAWRKLPLPISACCTMTASFLTHTHVYAYKVVASNGTAGPDSDVVQATSTYAPPPAPQNLRGRSAGDGTIDLDWDPAGENLSYWVYQRDVTAGESFRKLPLPISNTYMTAAFLVNGHAYEFKVSASNAGGEGPASAVVRVTATGGLPAKPTNLAATVGDGTVRLTWTASTTSGVSYDIYQRDATAGQSWQKLPYPVTTCCTFNGNLLTNGHTYEWKITATNIAGSSAASNVVSGRPMPPLPARPTNLAASVGNATVRLTWTASPTSGVSYDIYQRDVTAGQAWRRLPYPTSCCTFNGNLLTNGHTYEWKITATNMTGSSDYSNTVSGRPMPPFPSAPSGLTATPKDHAVTLRWTASSTAGVQYVIYQRDATAGQAWQRLPYPTGCCTFNGNLLVNGHTYEWKVAATNLSGTSGTSNVASARPMPPIPQAPSGLTANGAVLSANLSWNASPTPGVEYRVSYRSLSQGQTSWTVLNQPFYTTSAYINRLAGLQAYEFRVAAINLSGQTFASQTAQAITYRRIPYGHPTRVRNQLNNSNAVAGLWALNMSYACQGDFYQIICFGLPPSFPYESQPITVGDYLFYRRGAAALEAELICEVGVRLKLRQKYGAGVADSQGPNLLMHEQIHSDQWARELSWGIFAAKYGADKMRYETAANLYWGGYRIYDSSIGGCR
jgi:fibronectin type 3 domain-containing protein